MRHAALAVLLAVATPAFAMKVPRAIRADPSITTIAYDEDDVTRLCVKPGRHVLVVLSAKESIQHWTIGYPEAWEFSNMGHRFTLRQKADDPSSDLTVYTDLRTYHFDLEVCRPLRRVTFTYPAAPAKVVAAATSAPAVPNAVAAPARNWRYSAQGSLELEPMAVSDDGTFTRLKFAAQVDLPAVYVVAADGSESIAAFHMEGDELVVHKVAAKLVLRQGSAVTCLFNEAASARSVSSGTATTVPNLQRVIQ